MDSCYLSTIALYMCEVLQLHIVYDTFYHNHSYLKIVKYIRFQFVFVA